MMQKSKTGKLDIYNYIEQALVKALGDNSDAAFLYISIDNLPMIISSHGFPSTSKMLDHLIIKLDKFLADGYIVGRYNNENIFVVIEEIKRDEVEIIANKIRRFIQNYGSKQSDLHVQLVPTIGSVDFPHNAKTAIEVIEKAYIALDDAKGSYLHHVAYSNKKRHEIESTNILNLANHFQSAFIKDKLKLAFQPIIDSKTGNVAYYECLLRIVDKDNNIVSAGPYIPVAEKMGFMGAIDIFVLEKAVQELKSYPDITLSINISNASIVDSNWLDLAHKFLKSKKIAKRLIVEIIETAEQHHLKKAFDFVQELQKLGCKVALDDFGTGYTSFVQLKTLKVNVIKIDGSYIKTIARDEESRFFVKMMLEYSRKFGLESVAEFVENKEIADILVEMGVDYMQGYYFSPPLNKRPWAKD